MTKTSVLIIDKKDEFGVFRFEERIKSPQFKEGVDYVFDGINYIVSSPSLVKDILLIKNPYSNNVDDYAADLELRVFIDRQEEINLKPQIVADLERREHLIEQKKRKNQVIVGRLGEGTPEKISYSSGENKAIEDKKGEDKKKKADLEQTQQNFTQHQQIPPKQ